MFGIRRSHILCLVMAIFAANPTWAQPSGIKKVTSVEGITEYQLDNGMQVLLFPDASKPTFTVNITYRVGSRHEGRGESGMAHLLEHMVFKGTPTYSNIWGVLEDHGANFNGTTWVDRTNYYESLPANDENLDFALKMEADRMINSEIKGEELAKEMTVVRNEFERGENSPSSVLSERMMSAAYLWHNYGKSTIGNRSDIERVPVENLKKFYKKYYQPDNATLVVAGKFDEAQTLELIKKYFGSIPRPDRKLESTYTEEPAQDGPRLVTLKRVGDVPVVGALYHIPSGAHEDFPAVVILESILTHQPSGLLYRRLIVSGLATSVSGAAFSFAEPGVIEFMADVSAGEDPKAVLGMMTDTIENFASAGVDQKDVERAIARQMKQIKLAMTNSQSIGVRLSESIAQGDWRLFFLQRDRLKTVTADDVKRVASKYLVESNRTAGMFLPTESPSRTTIPARPDVAAMMDGYQGKEEIAQGEEIKPDVDYLESRITRTTLPSGIQLAVFPKESRGDAVQAVFRFQYGSEESLTGRVTAAELVPPMLMRGTKNKNYEELRDAIDALESQISVSSGGGGLTGGEGRVVGSIRSDRKNFIDSIELLAEIMKEPVFDEKEFKIIKNQFRSRAEEGKSNPQLLGIVALVRAMSPWPEGNIRYVPTIEEELELLDALTLDDVKNLYQQLYGASNLQVAIVGDFDVDQATAAIEEAFADWKSKQPFERIDNPFKPTEGGEITINTPDKEMAMVAAGTSTEMKDDDDNYPAMVLASYVLGSSSKSRLLNRLRQKSGLSYGANGMFQAGSQDDRATLLTMAICAPQNAAKARAALIEEVQRWIDDGLTEKELEEAKNSYGLKYTARLTQDSYLVRQLLSGLELDRTLHFQQNIVDKIQTLSLDDIKNALHATLKNHPLAIITAGDLERKDADDDDQAPEEGKKAAQAAKPLPPALAQLDKDKDGKIQKSEAPEELVQAFAILDRNEDGAIDGAEFAAVVPANPWPQLVQFDANEDGKIQKSELPEAFQSNFQRMDVDKNGVVEEADFINAG